MKAILETPVQPIANVITRGAACHGYRYTTEFASDDKLYSTITGTHIAIMYLIGALYSAGEFGLIGVEL